VNRTRGLLPSIASMLLAFAAAFSAGPSLAALDIFLKIDGIAGESLADKHAKEIDVLAWSWGALGAMPRVQKLDGHSFCAQALNVTKFVDSATAPLLAKAASGAVIPKARLTVRKGGSEPFEYLLIDLSDVRVASEAVGGSEGQNVATESVSFSFAGATVTYTPQNPDGKPGSPLATSVSPGCL
jgi:type VI secretion system secreted protein Hcp